VGLDGDRAKEKREKKISFHQPKALNSRNPEEERDLDR